MIAFLRGRVAARGAGWAELDVGGIGFHVTLSTHGSAVLPAPGGTATVPTALVIREEGAALFGFRDDAERAAFTALTGVATIGPKTAIAVLSALTPEALGRAVESDDLTTLTQVPGIGRKTAQRLVLELKGRLPGVEVGGPERPAATASGPEGEARAALVALGYSVAEAAAALDTVRAEGADSGALVRAALRELGTRR